jgi:hypothetical protein
LWPAGGCCHVEKLGSRTRRSLSQMSILYMLLDRSAIAFDWIKCFY